MLSPLLAEIAHEKMTRLMSESGSQSVNVDRRTPTVRLRLPALATVADLKPARGPWWWPVVLRDAVSRV